MSSGGFSSSYANNPADYILGVLDAVANTELRTQHIRAKADRADRRKAKKEDRENGGDNE